MASKLEAALSLARRGFEVFPLKEGTKNQPLLKSWPALATSDENLISMQWGSSGTPNANIGIHCAGLVVIDVDVKKGGPRGLALLRLTEGLPDTLEANTPSGGQHIFFRLPDDHPGCPNGVDVLGPGLDIRSAGGYVVAAGSDVAAGVYAWRNTGAAIADAPAWLLQRLGQTRPKAPTADVPDAPAASVERAAQWLQGAERSVKGQGGDQAAFRVACRLRDLGMSYDQACELMRSEAWDHGCGWRDGWLEDKPIRSAYTYAQNEDGGGRGVVEDDLPIPERMQAPEPKQKKSQGRAIRADVFAVQEGSGPGYVVKRLLPRAAYAVAFGPPAIGKSFLFLDIGYHVAHSKPWMGLLVRGGPVLYLAFEGIGGLKARARALQKKYGDDLGPLYIVGGTMNLRELAGRQELGAIMAEMPEKPVLIVIDTFARALMGGDENSAQDVGALNDAIAKLIGNTGACVLLVHHTGKNKAAGARGSSAIQGAVDTEIEIEMGFVKSTKQRDNECLPPIAFKLRPVVIGIDADGEEETSCVVEPSTAAQALMKKPLTGKAEHAFNILSELTGLDNTPVARAQWTHKMVAEGFSKSTAHEWVRKLAHRGYAMLEDDYVRRMLK